MENCLVCGEELVYSTESAVRKCLICKKEATSTLACEKGHFICDTCHLTPALNDILGVAASTESTSPLEIAEEMMRRGAVTMHGPEHHVIVAVAIMAAVRNAAGLPDEKLMEAVARAKKVPGGICGAWGVCAAAAGVGIAVSVLVGATSIKGKEKVIATRVVSIIVNAVADEVAPRCCKRSVRRALILATKYIREDLEIPLSDYPKKIVCGYTKRNSECIDAECPYYGRRLEQ